MSGRIKAIFGAILAAIVAMAAAMEQRGDSGMPGEAMGIGSGFGTVIGDGPGSTIGSDPFEEDGTDPLDVGLLARYEFDGAGMSDATGNGYDIDTNTSGDLTVAGYGDDDGVRLTGGAAGGAGNAHMSLEPGIIPRACTNGASMGVWVKVEDLTKPKYLGAQGIGESFIMKYLNTTGTGIDRTILCGIKDNTGTPIQVLAAGPHNLITADTWIHVACVFDRDTDTLTGYVDGTAGTPVAVSTSFGSLNNDPATVNNGGFSMGCLPPSQNCTGVQAFSAVTIDDMRVWERALSAAEVAQLAAM